MRKLFQTTVLAALLAVAGAQIPAPANAQNAPVVSKLADNIYSIHTVFYSSIVVIGDDGVLIADPANRYRAGILKDEIAKLTDKPVTKIVLTHEHFDHVGGTEVFEGAEIIAQENVTAVFHLDPLGLTPVTVDVTFSNKHTIDMGSTSVELKYLGAGDGVATTIIYLPNEDIVATADLYDENQLTLGAFLDDKNMLGVRSILNEVSGWDMKHAISTHSTGTDPAVLRANAKYFNDLYDAVFPTVMETASTNPAGIWELPGSLSVSVKLPQYESWANYDQLPHHVRRMVLAIIHGG